MQDGGTKRQRGADGDVARLKIPPHSVEAEQSVLGVTCPH